MRVPTELDWNSMRDWRCVCVCVCVCALKGRSCTHVTINWINDRTTDTSQPLILTSHHRPCATSYPDMHRTAIPLRVNLASLVVKVLAGVPLRSEWSMNVHLLFSTSLCPSVWLVFTLRLLPFLLKGCCVCVSYSLFVSEACILLTSCF